MFMPWYHKYKFITLTLQWTANSTLVQRRCHSRTPSPHWGCQSPAEHSAISGHPVTTLQPHPNTPSAARAMRMQLHQFHSSTLMRGLNPEG